MVLKVRRMLVARRGFTLIELLVVMGIILILVGLAIPAVNVARNRAKDTEVKAGCNTIQAALEQYGTDHTGFYPGAQWVKDWQDPPGWYTGPGVIGALPSWDGPNPRKDFTVPKTNIPGIDTNPADRDPYIDDGSGDPLYQVPNPQVLDALTANGYLTDYPRNPFIAATGGARAQMSNIFLFNPIPGADGVPNPGNAATLDWNCYTPNETGTTMRRTYQDYGRGFFTYIPLNPYNVGASVDFETTLDLPVPLATDLPGQQYYARCRSYMLVGWGNNRMDDSNAKGLSMKYWRTDTSSGESWFDFDSNMRRDLLETWLSEPADFTPTGLVGSEMLDSSNSMGKFGDMLSSGGFDIDSAFYGAAFFHITGS
jgi:prepilin-type N-terminal cleavage/methylation domain-containing protein